MEFEIVLRSDSTLRGHFPLECEAAEEVLGQSDVWILAPFFEQGGRYTVRDTHFVAEGDVLVPVSRASLTSFFAYLSWHTDCVRESCSLYLCFILGSGHAIRARRHVRV